MTWKEIFACSLAVAAVAAAAGCGTESPSEPDATAVREVGVIAAGELEVPAATSFEEPGFHESFSLDLVVPADLAGAAGRTLTLALWDADRPDQTCTQDHPLSGCATVDWSDAIGRPNVPATGVFDNRIDLELTTGPRTYYLTELRGLADEPDPYTPS